MTPSDFANEGEHPLRVRRAVAADCDTVARLLFARQPPARQAECQEQFRRLWHGGVVQPEGVILCQDGTTEDDVAVLVVHYTTGDSAVVMLPSGPAVQPDSAATQVLLQALLGLFAEQQVQQAHLFLDHDDDAERAWFVPFARIGFTYITQLVQMSAAVAPVDLSEQVPVQLNPIGVRRDDFITTLHTTMEGSLDIPELNVDRSQEAIATRMMQTVIGETTSWFVAKPDGATVGVVILATTDGTTWELIYLGILSAFRGQGFGRAALHAAVNHVVGRSGQVLNLSVDQRNTPAFTLYQSCGLRLQRLQQLCLWRRL